MNFTQHIRAILILGLPLIGSHLAQFAIQLVDTVMLGWYSVDALAASVLAGSYFFLVFIMGAGFAFAVMPLVASAAETGDEFRIRRVTRMGLWLSIFFAFLVLPTMIWSDPVLRRLGQDPELALASQDYLRIAGWGLFPALLVMVLKSYLAALERTSVILWLTVAAVFVNGGLNYLFIFGALGAPELGLRGAALASVMTHLATLVAACIYILRTAEFAKHKLFQRLWRADWPVFRDVFKLGWPICLTNLAESGMFHASALIMGLVGTLALAAHGIALQITATAFMIHVGLSQAATVRAGRALGRKDWDGMRLGGQAALTMSLCVVAVTTIVFLSVPELLISGFLDTADPDRDTIIEIGSLLLAVAALFQLVDAGQVMLLGLLRGVQDARVPMVMAAMSYWGLGIPGSYLLGIWMGIGPVGVWFGLVIGLGFATLMMGARWRQKLQLLSHGRGGAAPA